MDEDRGNQPHGQADRTLKQRMMELLRLLDRISQERGVHLTEYRFELNRLREQLKQAHKDPQAKGALGENIEVLIQKLKRLLPAPELKRSVRVMKIGAQQEPQGESEGPVVGWEEAPPIVGKRYRVFRDEGGVFSTSLVSKIAAGYFQTRNSVYKIEVLEQKEV